MNDAELIRKNDELHLRQAERAALNGNPKSIAEVLGVSVPEAAAGMSAAASNGRPFDLAGLVDRIRSAPRAPDPEYEEMKRRSDEQAKQHRIRTSGVPDRYMDETFGTYKPRSQEEAENLAAIRKFVDDSREEYVGVLVMLGNNGTGKSHLGCSCIQEREGLYIDIPTLEIEVECSRDFSAQENKLTVLNKYVRPAFLVIDEIGRATSPTAERSILYYVLNKRYNLRKNTVLITNYTAKELDDNLGTAIMDRIAEKRVRVTFTGQSYRRGNR